MVRRVVWCGVLLVLLGETGAWSLRQSLLRLGATTKSVSDKGLVAMPPPEVFGPLDGSPICEAPPGLSPFLLDGPATETDRRPLDESLVTLEAAGLEDLAECSTLLVASFFEAASRHPAFLAVTAHREHKRLRTHRRADSYSGDGERAPAAARHAQIVARHARSGDAVGYVDLDGRPKKDPLPGESHPRPYLSDLAVRPDARRRGLATRLVAECERLAKSWGYECLYLKVEAANDPARAMYADLGYEVIHVDSAQKRRCTLKKTLSGLD